MHFPYFTIVRLNKIVLPGPVAECNGMRNASFAITAIGATKYKLEMFIQMHYGVRRLMVKTAVCEAANAGSIPVDHPELIGKLA